MSDNIPNVVTAEGDARTVAASTPTTPSRTDTSDVEIAKAKINARQAIIVALISSLGTLLGTYALRTQDPQAGTPSQSAQQVISVKNPGVDGGTTKPQVDGEAGGLHAEIAKLTKENGQLGDHLRESRSAVERLESSLKKHQLRETWNVTEGVQGSGTLNGR
jgi:hypothetical protein